MDRRTLIAITLSVAIYVGWMAVFPPPPPPQVDEPIVAEQIEPAPLAGEPDDGRPDEVVPVSLCNATAELHTVDGSLRQLTLTNRSGRMKVQELWSWILTGMSEPWQPYGPPPGPADLLSADASALVAGSGPLERLGRSVSVVSVAPGHLHTRGHTADGLVVERVFEAKGTGADCAVELTVRWNNPTGNEVAAATWLSVHDTLPEATSSYDLPMHPRALVDGSVEGVYAADDLEEGPLRMEGKPGWFGRSDTFFLFALLPTGGEAATAAVFTTVQRSAETVLYGVHQVWEAPLAPGATREARFRLYADLKVSEALTAVDPSLAEAVELGFFSAFGWPLLWLLEKLHGYTLNWGLAIIALTLLVKALFFPLTQAGFKSGQAMSALQPQMQALKVQYKNSPEELNRATMALFTENKVNPLGGCLPMILQMPVWFALFAVLQNTADLYHASFLYLGDLSQPDPYLLSPTLVATLMIVQQRLTPMPNMEPAQQQMMKYMPYVFSVFFFMLPAGLVVYTFVNMSLSILQQTYIRRTFRISSDKGAITPA